MDCSKPTFPDSSLNIVQSHVANPLATLEISVLHGPSLAPLWAFSQTILLARNAWLHLPCRIVLSVNLTASTKVSEPLPKVTWCHHFVPLQFVFDCFKMNITISIEYQFPTHTYFLQSKRITSKSCLASFF